MRLHHIMPASLSLLTIRQVFGMFELFITNFIKSIIFPPGGIFLLLFFGLLLLKRKPQWGRSVLWSALLVGYLLSTPLISGMLLVSLQSYPALSKQDVLLVRAEAIVVLSAGRYLSAPEYQGDTVDSNSLERIRYGAYLQRQTGLPILVTGGRVLNTGGESLAAVMAKTLEQEFSIDRVWMEDKSRTTAENAFLSQKILADKGINRVFLVTHAYHMPRAVNVFQGAGIDVIPAPTQFSIPSGHWSFAMLPSAAAMGGSYRAIHEWVGRLWYILRH